MASVDLVRQAIPPERQAGVSRYDQHMQKKDSPVLHLANVPDDHEGQLAVVLAMYRKLTGKKPTPKEIEDARKELGE